MAQFKHVIITTITGGLAVVLLLVLGTILGDMGGEAFFGVVFFAGSLGASTNNYRRLLKLHTTPDGTFQPQIESDTDPIVQKLVIAQIYMSAVIGGMFGLILLALFVSRLVQGDLFPTFVTEGEGWLSISNSEGALARFGKTSVASAPDAAKVIVWSFVAGFSEQFVPNILDNLAKSGESLAARGSEAAGSGESSEQQSG